MRRLALMPLRTSNMRMLAMLFFVLLEVAGNRHQQHMHSYIPSWLIPRWHASCYSLAFNTLGNSRDKSCHTSDICCCSDTFWHYFASKDACHMIHAEACWEERCSEKPFRTWQQHRTTSQQNTTCHKSRPSRGIHEPTTTGILVAAQHAPLVKKTSPKQLSGQSCASLQQ